MLPHIATLTLNKSIAAFVSAQETTFLVFTLPFKLKFTSFLHSTQSGLLYRHSTIIEIFYKADTELFVP